MERGELATRIKVPERFIVAIEDGRYDLIPEDIYSRIYLKAYCAFLRLDAAKIHGMYRVERMQMNRRRGTAADENRHPRTSVPMRHMVVAPKVVKGIIIGLIVLGLGIYFTAALKKIVVPPTISLNSPRDGFVTTERSITISGKTEPEVRLLINGKQTPTDEDGNFQDTLTLQEGLNTVKVVGSKKYSKKMTVMRRIIVEPKERTTASLDNVVDVPL